MSSWSQGSSPSLSPCASPSLLRSSWAADVIPLPPELEEEIRVEKNPGEPLGLQLEAVDKAINGCMVKSLLKTGAVGKDNRVHAGDLVTKLNNETLRNVTNSQARTILRRANLISNEV